MSRVNRVIDGTFARLRWRVISADVAGDPDLSSVAIADFSGPDAESQARAYAKWADIINVGSPEDFGIDVSALKG